MFLNNHFMTRPEGPFMAQPQNRFMAQPQNRFMAPPPQKRFMAQPEGPFMARPGKPTATKTNKKKKKKKKGKKSNTPLPEAELELRRFPDFAETIKSSSRFALLTTNPMSVPSRRETVIDNAKSTQPSAEASDEPKQKKKKKKKKKSVPEGWRVFRPVGDTISSTRMFGFKVPLHDSVCQNMLPGEKFTTMDLFTVLQCQRRELGMVIDLTNTDRYYNSSDITDVGVEYVKIFTEGQFVPKADIVQRFQDVVVDFFRRNKWNNKQIGVYCTHGVNRTGYMICRYMADCLKWSPDEAIEAFNEARGHCIARENYVDDLKIRDPRRPDVTRDVVKHVDEKTDREERDDFCSDETGPAGAGNGAEFSAAPTTPIPQKVEQSRDESKERAQEESAKIAQGMAAKIAQETATKIMQEKTAKIAQERAVNAVLNRTNANRGRFNPNRGFEPNWKNNMGGECHHQQQEYFDETGNDHSDFQESHFGSSFNQSTFQGRSSYKQPGLLRNSPHNPDRRFHPYNPNNRNRGRGFQGRGNHGMGFRGRGNMRNNFM